MLMRQSYRASRLVVDTGLHSMSWTREQVQKYMHGGGMGPYPEMEK